MLWMFVTSWIDELCSPAGGQHGAGGDQEVTRTAGRNVSAGRAGANFRPACANAVVLPRPDDSGKIMNPYTIPHAVGAGPYNNNNNN